MNLLNEPSVSRSEFRKLLNIRCHNELGVGLMDLPDIICIDDVWWEGISLKEANQMIDGCVQDFKDDMGFEEPCVPVDDLPAPIYSIDE